MKKNHFILLLALLSASFVLQSCLKDDDEYDDSYSFPNALVTVKSVSDGSVYLQLDDSTTLKPVNMKTSPYGTKEVRALVSCYLSNDNAAPYNKAVFINWMDSIRTKNTVATSGTNDDERYGSDPLELVNDWVTIAEDGYLTLRFRTVWGNGHSIHYLNLVRGVNPNNPYELELHHDAKGDVEGEMHDGLIAFSLKDLPDTGGKTVKLKINWKSFSGNKSVEFNYCTNKSSGNKVYNVDRSLLTSYFK
jgi:hypothetical protein